MLKNINLYQINRTIITFSNDKLNNIFNSNNLSQITSITLPALSCSYGSYNLGVIELKYPSSYQLSGTLSLTVVDYYDNINSNQALYIYSNLKNYIDTKFDLTITLSISELDPSSNKVTSNVMSIKYLFKNCLFSFIPSLSFTLIDEPDALSYDIEIMYEKFSLTI